MVVAPFLRHSPTHADNRVNSRDDHEIRGYWILGFSKMTNAGAHMTIELKMLALSVVLGLVQIVLSAQSKNLQHGYRWAAGPRDDLRLPLSGIAGRLERALTNFLETFPLFAAAVLMAAAMGVHNWMTEWGAGLYFWGRLAYLPLYAFGVFLVRSLAWNVATAGIVLILLAVAI
jgi:uncharacterized MAPEG superfamily protein